MDEHAGGIDDAAKRRPTCRRQRLGQPLLQVPGVRPGPDLLAGAFEHGPCRGDSEWVVHVTDQLIDGWQLAQLHEMSVKPPERLLCKP